jgi:hypothetical protein
MTTLPTGLSSVSGAPNLVCRELSLPQKDQSLSSEGHARRRSAGATTAARGALSDAQGARLSVGDAVGDGLVGDLECGGRVVGERVHGFS